MNVRGRIIYDRGDIVRKLIDGRCTGKPTKLIYTSHIMGYTILVATEKRKMFVEDTAKRMGRKLPTPLTVTNILHENRGSLEKPPRLIIDDSDDVIRNLIQETIGGTVEVISLNTEGSVSL